LDITREDRHQRACVGSATQIGRMLHGESCFGSKSLPFDDREQASAFRSAGARVQELMG
jgi:hypothetical protein